MIQKCGRGGCWQFKQFSSEMVGYTHSLSVTQLGLSWPFVYNSNNIKNGIQIQWYFSLACSSIISFPLCTNQGIGRQGIRMKSFRFSGYFTLKTFQDKSQLMVPLFNLILVVSKISMPLSEPYYLFPLSVCPSIPILHLLPQYH